jgi:hypothetical protein
MVPEQYMKKVPVTRSRQVRLETMEIREVDDYEIVEVAGSQAIEVDGFRVDQVIEVLCSYPVLALSSSY